jgi:predicted Zn-dependent peptidase
MNPPRLRSFRAGALPVVFERRRGPLTAITLGVRSGSRFDGDFPGIAHFAEHMLFQGTASLDHSAINRRAAELGGDHDATTGYEDMHLTFQVRNADVPDALGLLAEQVLRPTVPAARFENERQVIAQEIRGHREDAIGFLADEAWRRFVSGGLGHPPSGNLTTLRTIERRHVRSFLRERLVGANMVLSIVGDVAAATLRRTAARAFRDLPVGRRLAGRGMRVARTGEVRLRRGGLTQLYVTTLFAVPDAPRSLVALGLALDVLGTDPDGRLYHEVRERRGLSYDLWADLQAGAGWAAMQVGAVAERRAERPLERAIDQVFRDAAEKGFGDDEIARARRKVRYRYARLAEAKLDRSAAHAASVLYGALGLEEAEAIVSSLSKAEVEEAWRAAMSSPRLRGILTD